MNVYRIPLLFALTGLAAGILFARAPLPPRDVAPPCAPQPVLPRPAAAAPVLVLPSEITIFGRADADRPAVTVSTAKTDASRPAETYRLCAFAGGGEEWIVSIEDASGRYHTLRRGDCIPGSSLEFRSMEFSFVTGGIPESRAVFFDSANSRRVDVTAFAGPGK